MAEDAPLAVEDCAGELYLGCGAEMAPGTFFSGLIDDIRLYNRAVKP